MAKDTKNFKVKEFACKHCGVNKINQKVIYMVQKIRDALGVPLYINSGYRCEEHNAAVGGVKNSYHVQGLAADLSCSLGAKVMYDTVKKLYGQGRIPELAYCILYKAKNFIHVDCGHKRNNRWEERA